MFALIICLVLLVGLKTVVECTIYEGCILYAQRHYWYSVSSGSHVSLALKI